MSRGKSLIKLNRKYAFKIEKANYRSKQRRFTLSKRENVIRDCAKDFGFDFEKAEGLFTESDWRRRTGHPGLLDLN